MARKRKGQQRNSRDAPCKRSSGVMLCSPDAWKILCGDGYKPVMQCPEVQMAINNIAKLVSIMTIHLMQNRENGDVRVKNELSRKLDITPAGYMGRTNMVFTIVKTLLETGNQVTYPVYRNGYLEQLVPLPPSRTTFRDEGAGYRVVVNGIEMSPDEVLHFAYNPDPERPWVGRGLTATLKDVVGSIRQAGKTKNALLESPAPSIIVKVDGLTEEFASPEGQDRLAERYASASQSGQPWFIPSEAFAVEQVKPLTLADLAIKDSLELDRRSVAAIIGVPPYMVGVGSYNEVEYNNFVSTQLPFITRILEQEMTAKLLISPDYYIRFNSRSLMNYAMKDLISAGAAMVDRMAMRRNEWRDWLGMTPDEEMEDLLALENYVPADRLGDQKKLQGGDSDGNA